MGSPLFQLHGTCQTSARRQRGMGWRTEGHVSLHNITDVIAGIRYPVSATDTRYEPKVCRVRHKKVTADS